MFTPPGWDASPSQSYPRIKFAGTHLYTWVERGTVRVKQHDELGLSVSDLHCSNHDATASVIVYFTWFVILFHSSILFPV